MQAAANMIEIKLKRVLIGLPLRSKKLEELKKSSHKKITMNAESRKTLCCPLQATKRKGSKRLIAQFLLPLTFVYPKLFRCSPAYILICSFKRIFREEFPSCNSYCPASNFHFFVISSKKLKASLFNTSSTVFDSPG